MAVAWQARVFIFTSIIMMAIAALSGSLHAGVLNASSLVVNTTRWGGASAISHVTTAGNISQVNVTATTLTSKWAAYSGNVTGNINLTDGSYSVFSWSWSPTTGGEVCVSTASTFPFGSIANQTTASTIDTAWSFSGSAPDSVANTFTANTCNLSIGSLSSTIANTRKATHSGDSNFVTCAYNDGSTAAKADFAFCTNISSTGTNFRGASANYELLVPTASGSTETYYFFVELR